MCILNPIKHQLLPRSRCKPGGRNRLLFLFPLLLLTAGLKGQPPIAVTTPSLTGYAWGSGKTTGHVATLVLFNASPGTLNLEAGPYFIPGSRGYQGYVIPHAQTVVLPPFGTAYVELNGYCTHIRESAVPDGERITDFSQWITPETACPVPAPGMKLSAADGFEPAPPPDSVALAFPGTAIPFPYRISLNDHPASVAGMLVHAARQLEKAYDARKRQMPSLPLTFNREAAVQQALWYVTSLIERTGYSREAFTLQVIEQIEQQLNVPSRNFTQNAMRSVLVKADEMWGEVTSMCRKAELICLLEDKGNSTTGKERPFMEAVERLKPAASGAFSQWRSLKSSFKAAKNWVEAEEYVEANWRLNELLKTVIEQEIQRLPKTAPATGPTIITMMNCLTSELTAEMDERDVQGLLHQLGIALQDWLTRRMSQTEDKARPPLNDLALVLVAFGSEDLTAPMNPAFLETQRSNLIKQHQGYIVAEASVINSAVPEAGIRIPALKEMLQTGYLATSLDGNMSTDLLIKLDDDWRHWLRRRSGNIDMDQETAIEHLLNLHLLLGPAPILSRLDYLMHEKLKKDLNGKLGACLEKSAEAISIEKDNALPDILFNLSRLEGLRSYLQADDLARLQNQLKAQLNRQLMAQAAVPAPVSETYLLDWRNNELIRTYDYYQTFATEETNSRMKQHQLASFSQWESQQKGRVNPNEIDFDGIDFTGEHWKTVFLTEYPVLEPEKPFPWLIAALPITAAAALLSPSDKGAFASSTLEARDDQVTLGCAESVIINILANDSGDGISVKSITDVEETVVTQMGDGNFSITKPHAGSFSFMYTITDRYGQIDSAFVNVQVVFPELTARNDSFYIQAQNILQANFLANDNSMEPEISVDVYPTGGELSMGDNGAFSFTPDEGFCGAATFQYTVTDLCDQEASAVVMIMVEDDVAPALECPEDRVIACQADPSPVTTGEASGSDNCDPDPEITYVDDIAQGECAGEQSIVRTWRITDASGNTTSCTQHISQTDEAGPVLNCPPFMTATCGQDLDPSNIGGVTADDNCTPAENLSITYMDNLEELNGCNATGTILRTWTAVDDCGRSSQCVQQILLTDSAGPDLILPPDITLACGESTAPSHTGQASATDDCTALPELAITYEDDPEGGGGCSEGGGLLRTWIATDVCGNVTTGVQIITIADETAPVLDCPGGVFVSCEQDVDPLVIGGASVTDNCDPDPSLTYEDELLSGSCLNERMLTRTWTATDVCGNQSQCVQVITIGDTLAPVLTIPLDANIDCSLGADPSFTGQATAEDNCSGPGFIDITFSDVVVPGNCGGESVITRTWTATDPCGNASAGVQTINLVSTTGPDISCPPDITISCSESPVPALTGEPAAVSGCVNAGTIATWYSDDIISNGNNQITIRRTWVATTPCGNSSQCEQMIVIDLDPGLTVICPQDVTVDCTETDDLTFTGEPEVSLDCSPLDDILVEFNDNDEGLNGCGGTGQTIRTWTATDLNGNTAACQQVITVQDDTGPTITCPADLFVDVTGGTAPALTGEATAVDDCSAPEDVSLSFADDFPDPPGCSGTGSLNRTWTATDACGNTSSCTQVITLQDIVAPLISCPLDVTVEAGQSTSPDATGIATASDDATPVDDLDLQYADDLTGLAGCGGTGTFIRTWTTADLCANVAGCSQLITVEDTTPPLISCPPDVSISCNIDPAPGTTGQATATDNNTAPDELTIAYQDDTDSLMVCEGTGTILRTWTATDLCGNTTSCVQQIIVFDNLPPTINCPPTANVLCGQQSDTVITGTATAFDNCNGNVDLSFTDDLSALAGCEGEIIRTWTAIDPCGNISGCEQGIIVSEVTCNFAVSFEVTPAVCNESNGSITALVDPPGSYTFEWETGDAGAQLTGITGGTYGVTLTDTENNCAEIFEIVVDESAVQLIDLISVTPSNCNGTGDIVLNLTGQAPFSVVITGPGSITVDNVPAGILPVSSFLSVTAGTYAIEVTDSEGCTDALSVTVPAVAPFELTVQSFLHPSAPGAADGSVTIQVLGPPTYLLDVFVNGEYYSTEALPLFTISNLPAGTHTIYAIDQYGDNCQSNEVIVTLVDPPTILSLELLPVVDRRYRPEILMGRQQATDRQMTRQALRTLGIEMPLPEVELEYAYGFSSLSHAVLVFRPGAHVDVRAVFSRISGSGAGMLSLPDNRVLSVNSAFSGYSAEIGSRYYPLTGTLRPFAGVGVTGHWWRTAFHMTQNQQAVFRQDQQMEALTAFLSTGLRFRFSPSFWGELEFQLGESENLPSGQRQLMLYPNLNGFFQW